MSFSKTVDMWATKTPQQLNKVKQTVSLRLFAAVIKDTPVLEGTLRGDWQVTIGTPAQTRAATQVSIEAFIGSTQLKDKLFLTNNMPYVYGIEFLGWSKKKAPQGMMRKNAMRFNSILKQAIRSVNNGTS